jgi:hypothetical protein
MEEMLCDGMSEELERIESQRMKTKQELERTLKKIDSLVSIWNIRQKQEMV